jgi:hypothetical protein
MIRTLRERTIPNTSRLAKIAFAFALLGVLFTCLLARSAHASTFTVTTTNNSGTGSLRQAIKDANANNNLPVVDTIEFNIPGSGPHTITPTSALPDITEAVTIDGYSQPGASQNTLAQGNDAALKIELSGANAGSAFPFVEGLTIKAKNSTVKGLVINRWSGMGVWISGSGATGNKVTGNYIGTDTSGTTTTNLGNSSSGVVITDASNNTVGGTAAEARNLISGNAHGVGIGDPQGGGVASGNRVQGNYIGTDKNGTADLGNTFDGVSIEQAPNNRVGGTVAGQLNIISANGENGVSVSGTRANGNKVYGNYIGLDVSGMQDLGNRRGVVISDAPNNRVGGTAAGALNTISGNDGYGVGVSGGVASGNRVQGNYIGTDKNGIYTGLVDIGNSDDGVSIEQAPNNRVGGTAPGAPNTIHGNDGDGVSILGSGAMGNRILSNSIHFNGLLGIDLSPLSATDGVTANDNDDPDTGPNRLQNYPVLSSASSSGSSTTINGNLNSTASTSTASTTFRIQFFSSPTADGSNHGEGQKFLGQTSVTTNGNGNANFSFIAPAVAVGEVVTATATNPGSNTSEFSDAIVVS